MFKDLLDRNRLSRRKFLKIAGLTGANAALLTASGSLIRATAGATGSLWSDPATWGGKLPGPNDVLTISGKVILDVDATVAGVVILASGKLVFKAGASRTLLSSGNVVVQGCLTMRPRSIANVHTLTFINVDESKFKGGGEEVMSSDVGLWVIDDGVLDVKGSYRLPWTRVTGEVKRGSNTITLEEAPTGWRAGDELVLTPTLAPATGRAESLAYDYPTIAAISGQQVTLSTPLDYDHPTVVAGGSTFKAEVLNLTRNVVIQGTQQGRAHIHMMAMRSQNASYATIRYVGPRQVKGGATVPVLGRYGFHFHHAGDATRGSLIEGLVVRDGGNHAFVPHASHGITFAGCISHNTFEDAFWWDSSESQFDMTNNTNALVWDRCVASLVQTDPPSGTEGYKLAGFRLGPGVGSSATECVAVGVQGTVRAAGFRWPAKSIHLPGVWKFEDCVAHNNTTEGIFLWQVTRKLNVLSRFAGFYNGGVGVAAGSYLNCFRLEDSLLYGNVEGAVEVIAASTTSAQGDPLTFINVTCDQIGLSDFTVFTSGHQSPPSTNTVFDKCSLKGHRKAAFGFIDTGGSTNPDLFDIVNCTFEGNEFWLDSGIRPESVILVDDSAHGNISLRRKDQAGIYKPEWNARVK